MIFLKCPWSYHGLPNTSTIHTQSWKRGLWCLRVYGEKCHQLMECFGRCRRLGLRESGSMEKGHESRGGPVEGPEKMEAKIFIRSAWWREYWSLWGDVSPVCKDPCRELTPDHRLKRVVVIAFSGVTPTPYPKNRRELPFQGPCWRCKACMYRVVQIATKWGFR